MHGGLNLCVFSKIYESELWATQVDGSLYVTPKHVLTGVKHSMIGHQTSQVKQLNHNTNFHAKSSAERLDSEDFFREIDPDLCQYACLLQKLFHF